MASEVPCTYLEEHAEIVQITKSWRAYPSAPIVSNKTGKLI